MSPTGKFPRQDPSDFEDEEISSVTSAGIRADMRVMATQQAQDVKLLTGRIASIDERHVQLAAQVSSIATDVGKIGVHVEHLVKHQDDARGLLVHREKVTVETESALEVEKARGEREEKQAVREKWSNKTKMMIALISFLTASISAMITYLAHGG